jgi:hypothetical protein
MAQTAELDVAADTIQATLNYIVSDGSPVFTIVATPGGRDARSGATPDPRRVVIHNGRPHTSEFALERDGFRFIRHDTRMSDFYDEDEIRRVYYAEMDELIKAETGCKRVHVFDHTLRTADDEIRESKKIREVVRRVHNDYTEKSGPQRVHDLLPAEADELLKRRFAIIQVWRPIRYPVETYPLAIADARSLSPQNLVISERRAADRIGQTYAITYNPAQQWYWFPQMRREEALVFKTYESMTDGRARWTAHTAFEDPNTPPNARPRESIEIRAFAFF